MALSLDAFTAQLHDSVPGDNVKLYFSLSGTGSRTIRIVDNVTIKFNIDIPGPGYWSCTSKFTVGDHDICAVPL